MDPVDRWGDPANGSFFPRGDRCFGGGLSRAWWSGSGIIATEEEQQQQQRDRVPRGTGLSGTGLKSGRVLRDGPAGMVQELLLQHSSPQG